MLASGLLKRRNVIAQENSAQDVSLSVQTFVLAQAFYYACVLSDVIRA